MTIFRCAEHGDYARMEMLPAKIPAICPACRDRFSSATQEAQIQTELACRLWQRWQEAEIPARYENRTIQNWKPRADQQGAAAMVVAWASDIDRHIANGEGLLLMGAPGVGKTHLLAGLITVAVQGGYKARYAAWPDIWDRCKPPFDAHPDTLLRELARVPLLALDEIALRPASDKEQARLFELVDARYREELPTLVATNATEATLSLIGERTADRLQEACIPIVVPGTSNRAQAAEDRALRHAPPPISKPVIQSVMLTVTANGTPEQRTIMTRWPT